MLTPRSISSVTLNLSTSGRTFEVIVSILFSAPSVSVNTRAPTGFTNPRSVAICCGLAGSPSCVTHQRPSRITSVSTTAIGHETNVLQNTEMITTSTESIQRISTLLNRLNAKLSVEDTAATDAARRPT